MYITIAVNISYHSLKPFVNKKNKPFLIALAVIFNMLPLFSIIDFIFRPTNIVLTTLATLGYVYGMLLIYYIVFFLIFSLIHLLFNKKNHSLVKAYLRRSTALVIGLVLIIYGLTAVQNPKVTKLSLGEGENNMKIVFLSDIHYSTTGSLLNLDKMVERINNEKPDIVLLGGDIIDNRIRNINKEKFKTAMRNINTRYGIYAILGNHEILRNDFKTLKAFYDETNVHLLADSTVKIDNKLLIVGRLDHKFERKALKDIMHNTSLPTIVLDHEPQDYKEAMENNVKLMLSGHTHNGQIFPFNYAVKIHYMTKYHTSYINGLYQSNDFNCYISRGYGAWGFPMRTTGNSEIVTINFKY